METTTAMATTTGKETPIMETKQEVRAGFIVAITEEKTSEDEPITLVATQLKTVYSLPDDVELEMEIRKKIKWSLGPVKVTGYVDTETFHIAVEIKVFGAKIFNLYADLQRGVKGKINFKLAKGEIYFFLKNEKEVWVRLNLKVKFDGSFNQEVKLLTL